MAMFRYKAMTSSGTIVHGRMAAESEAAVVTLLRREGHLPISAKPDDGGDLRERLRQILGLKQVLSTKVLALITQEMADLLGAGLDLDRVLGVMLALKDAQALRPMLQAVRGRVRDGSSFADALEEEPSFPKFYVNMVRAGETGGKLDAALHKLADYLTRSQTIHDQVASALVYPIVLLVTAGLSVAFLLSFVLPSFEPLFASAGQQLPLPTRIVMDISKAFRMFWWLGVLLAGLGLWWVRASLEKPGVRLKWHRRLLQLPKLGALLTDIELERFKRTLGTLIAGGMPVPNALQISRDVLRNVAIAGTVAEAAQSLREGDSLARLLGQSGYFPAATLDLIAIGEETGRLDEMLIRQADLDERRIKNQIERLIALLVPGLTIILGIVIAGLIASMLVAILGVNDIALQ